MKTYFVDSFTNQKFKGNPAAVCIAEYEPGTETMQSIASEIGFSETAFLKKLSGDRYSIRFFSPKKEIPLCGHATLASSKIIFDTTDLEQINFLNCENVELKIRKSEGKIVMQFPVYDTEEIQVPRPVLDALGIDTILDARYNSNTNIILLEINDTAALADLEPDFQALVQSHSGIDGILVTAQSGDSQYDFHYRYFWPWAGTNEDPVTGGVQTFLTKYWAMKLGNNRLNAFQSSTRTGRMTTELLEDSVLIFGEAVTVFEGEFIR
jgi:PhzF family phenazine biosynthesis protein